MTTCSSIQPLIDDIKKNYFCYIIQKLKFKTKKEGFILILEQDFKYIIFLLFIIKFDSPLIEKKKTIHGYLHTQKLGYNQLSEPNNDCNGSKEWIIIDK